MKWGKLTAPRREALNTPALSEIQTRAFGHFDLSAECKLYFMRLYVPW